MKEGEHAGGVLDETPLGRRAHVDELASAVAFLVSDDASFAALPQNPDTTLVRTTWLVHADAVEGVDYDLEDLTRVWRATNLQDATYVERAQRGLSNPAYLPGPYNPNEYQVEMSVNWYVTALRAHLGIERADRHTPSATRPSPGAAARSRTQHSRPRQTPIEPPAPTVGVLEQAEILRRARTSTSVSSLAALQVGPAAVTPPDSWTSG